jgi:hypothetical protein
MALISPSDQSRLRESFAAMTRRVRLLFFTQTLDCDTCVQTRQILDELPPLSGNIMLEEVNLVLDADTAHAYGVDRAPSIAITYQDRLPTEGHDAGAGHGAAAEWQDTRIRFVGTPAGYEFISLVQGVLLAGGRPSQLSAASLTRLAAVNRPMTVKVFTTPT